MEETTNGGSAAPPCSTAFEYRFSIRRTNHGATASMVTPSGRTTTKRFRDGYAAGQVTARRWVEDQIKIIREGETIDGHRRAEVFIDGIQQ